MDSLTKPPVETKILSASIDGAAIVVHWSNGHCDHIPSIYLRHSPGFPGGERPAGDSGRFPRTPDSLIPEHVEITDEGDLRLQWQPDCIESLHRAAWLSKVRGENSAPPTVSVWDSESIQELPEHDFQLVNRSESARLTLFEQVLVSGVAMIRDAPVNINSVLPFAELFGVLPPNPYSDDPEHPAIANIRINPAVPVATNMCHFLGPHTDTCWRQSLTGLLLMHCLKAHPDGGRSLLVDGFTVANKLQENSPASFELLSTIPLRFEARVSDEDNWHVMGRVLSVAADGTLEGVRYNGNSIGQVDLPTDLTGPMYKALEDFEAALYDRSLWWQPKLAPGDLLVIDNHRVLHGREAFDPGKAERHLQTCSVDRDSFHNSYRRLARKLGSAVCRQRLTAGVI